jgi:thymidylate synthase ThyX
MKRRIYVLRNLPPEVVAVAFAKCSRSPEPFDQIAAELNDDKSRQFHEKWIVGYGHGSVAEHAVLSLAIEGVSILATKVIEDNRLASYTEKSTRYQVFDRSTYYTPQRIIDSPLSALYTETMNAIMDTYTEIVPLMLEHFRRKVPRTPDVGETIYNVRIKNMALDSCRYLLPVSTLTNLGMTVNARALEHAISKLMTHPLGEMNDIGLDLKEAALGVTPTLIKYTNKNQYLGETHLAMECMAEQVLPGTIDASANVTMVAYDHDAEDKLITSILYRYSHLPFAQIRETVKKMTEAEREAVLDHALAGMGSHDRPLRELEHCNYTFDILIDYGAFRDIQRHRIATQTNQELTVEHGYSVPEAIVEAGLEDRYRAEMERARSAFETIRRSLPHEAQYIIPLAYKKRVLFTWNLREIHHFVRLRTGATSHISYKRVAQRIYEIIKEKQPLLAKYLTCGY